MKITVKAPLLARIRAQSYEEGDCLIWEGATSNGVPILSYRNADMDKRRSMGVRKAMLLDEGTSIREGVVLTSRCGNTMCVARKHIKVTDAKEFRRMVNVKYHQTAKASCYLRAAKIAATKRAKSKYSEELIAEIRNSEDSTAELVRKHKLSKDYINSIRRGEARRDYANPFASLL